MKPKKTWNKSKDRVRLLWNCEDCNKELLSNEGGWIINASKKYFCHDGRDGSCFDNYCKYIKEKQYAGTLWKKMKKPMNKKNKWIRKKKGMKMKKVKDNAGKR